MERRILVEEELEEEVIMSTTGGDIVDVVARVQEEVTIQKSTEDTTDFYVNIFCFSVTILCYIVLISVLGYTLWRIIDSVIAKLQRLCARSEDDSSVPYKVMKSRQNTPHITVIPIITNEDLKPANASNSVTESPPIADDAKAV